MKFLFVYPRHLKENNSWEISFGKSIGDKEIPPLPLLIPSIHLPITWERRFIDLNNQRVKTKDLQWSDYVYVYADLSQDQSTQKLLRRLRSLDLKVIGCGAYFKIHPDEAKLLDHFIMNHSEDSFLQLIHDLENHTATQAYEAPAREKARSFQRTYYSLVSLSNKLAGNIHLSHTH